MKYLTVILVTVLFWLPASAGGWAVHDNVNHWECCYSQNDAQNLATVKGWTAVLKSEIPQFVVDAKVDKKALANSDRATRRSEIQSKLTRLSNAQIDSYIDANVTDLASAREYLKRLTKVTRDLAREERKE